MARIPAAFVALVVALGLVAGTPVPAAAQATAQPQFTSVTVDFVPGEKTLFFDDFTDMAPGEPPKHFKVRGAAVDLQEAGALRQLAVKGRTSLTPTLAAPLPKNFTYQAELQIDAPKGFAIATLLLFSKDREAMTLMVRSRAEETGLVLAVKVPKFEELGRKVLKLDLGKPFTLAVWAQDGRVRVFVDDVKHLDVNQVDLPPIDRVQIDADVTGATAVNFRSVRIAESAPDVVTVFGREGRYVSHAILFDTDSDRLKPTSAAAIQGIARALHASPALEVRIEGHTDAQGDAAHNLDLSKRRAEAVKGVLVGQFGIDAARLATAGLGATRPIDTNDTPQGRAQNRRVEFVKQ